MKNINLIPGQRELLMSGKIKFFIFKNKILNQGKDVKPLLL